MSNHLKIMIVEDEAMHVSLLKMEISSFGWEVTDICASGTDAIEKARRNCPDVILIDIRLLGTMDGIEAASKIMEFCSAKIVFMTGYASEDIEIRAKELNPFAYYQKPVLFENLKNRLQKSSA